ncbi:MAG: hypothetical protein FWG79_06925 [Bacteroidales bacterium]|nr:hypothetical protein [Bacteroidales bacterium]
MKKLLVTLIAILGFGLSANANFSVTNVQTSNYAQNGQFSITVTVRPTFTPPERGWYTVVVVPTNHHLAGILGSQRQDVQIYFDGSGWTHSTHTTVVFTCHTNNRPQCTVNDFKVDSWFKSQ